MRRDIDTILDAWFDEGPRLAADRVIGDALTRTEHLPQRRHFAPIGRPMLLAAAALALILTLGIATWLGYGPLRLETNWRVLPSVEAPVEPGRYVVDSPFPVPIGMTIDTGWGSNPISDTYAQVTYLQREDGTGPAVFFTFVEGVYADPCHLEQGWIDPPPGPGVDQLAAALARFPGVGVTGPTDTTIGGFPAVELTLTAPPAFEGCTGELDGPPFRLWGVPQWQGMEPSERLRLWIVAVGGERLVIGSEEFADTTTESLAAVNTLLSSLRINPEGAVADASPLPDELCNPCSPLPAHGPLRQGRWALWVGLHRYLGDTSIPLERPVRVTFDTEAGAWSSIGNGIESRDLPAAGARLSAWAIGRIYLDPCHWRTSAVVEPSDLGRLESLANSFWARGLPGGSHGSGVDPPTSAPLVTKAPIDETRYGHFAQRVELAVPADVDIAACDGGEYRMWEDLEGRARTARGPGEEIIVWVTDLSPGLLVIDASTMPNTPDRVRELLSGMLPTVWVDQPSNDVLP